MSGGFPHSGPMSAVMELGRALELAQELRGVATRLECVALGLPAATAAKCRATGHSLRSTAIEIEESANEAAARLVRTESTGSRRTGGMKR